MITGRIFSVMVLQMNSILRSSLEKQSSYRLGVWAEWLCAVLLWCKGYGIIARRWKAAQGEVDIIARKGDTLVFVEVKARPTHQQAACSLSRQQRRRISNAAGRFISQNQDCRHLNVRFDLMLVSPWRLPQHVINAWNIDE